MSNENEHSIATFAALKTCIANGEVQSVKELLASSQYKHLKKAILLT